MKMFDSENMIVGHVLMGDDLLSPYSFLTPSLLTGSSLHPVSPIMREENAYILLAMIESLW